MHELVGGTFRHMQWDVRIPVDNACQCVIIDSFEPNIENNEDAKLPCMLLRHLELSLACAVE